MNRLMRHWRRSPAYATTIMMVVALVVAANAAAFSVVWGALYKPLPYRDAQELVGAIAQMVRPEGGQLTIRGHTDSLPWKDGVRGNNWSLSASRAEATRQALIRKGIGANRFARIEGVADRELLVEDNPQDPRNRRISILLMDK